MEIRLHPEAVKDLENALDYYKEIDKSLAVGILNEWEKAVSRIINNPKAWSLVQDQYRRCLLGRYPYGIIYRIKDTVIEIIALMHLKRMPGYWGKRLKI